MTNNSDMQDRKSEFVQFYINSHNALDIDPGIWMSNYIIDRMELNEEQILWFCFLFSITYHLPTAYLLINEFPDLEIVDIPRLQKWWSEVQSRCPFQTDKLKQRKFLPETIESYQVLVKGSQSDFFSTVLNSDANTNFDQLWSSVYKDIKHFGRFSVWNWAQMLKHVAHYDVEPDTLMLGQSFSESHTHGFCKACGFNDWAKKERIVVDGKRKKIVHKFSAHDIELLNICSTDIKNMIVEAGYEVDNYTAETVACAFKKLFRSNDSRYIGYYLDRQAEDIKKIESQGWSGVDWSLLWDARSELLNPKYNNQGVDKSKFSMDFGSKISSVNTKSLFD